MMISLSDAGKRFNREWIFRHFTYRFEEGRAYAIVGPNGSGKSTLLQAIGGSMHINEGVVKFEKGVPSRETGGGSRETGVVPAEEVFRHVSICAPYLEVIE